MTNFPPIIGLNGVARAGKDTVGGILRDLYGYELASFSDTLNKALIALNPWVMEVSIDGGERTMRRYAELIDLVGYERAKEYPEVRALLQRMGTEVGRNLLGPDIWVEALFNNLPTGKLIAITNVRFPNEYDAVKSRGGEVWHVHRPGFTPALGHISDTALDNHEFDVIIENNGTIKTLADEVMFQMDNPVQVTFR